MEKTRKRRRKITIDSLFNDADKACTLRGHDMEWFPAESDAAFMKREASCLSCGANVRIMFREFDGAVAVGGSAVLTTCYHEARKVCK